MPTPPPGPAPHSSFGHAQGFRTEGRLQPPSHVLDVHADSPQRTGRIGGGLDRRSDPQQLGPRRGQVQAVGLQQGGALAAAMT
jgi:hypothetical protein